MPELISIERPARAFFWTEAPADKSETTSEDPLGLDYVSQQVGLLILPTLTTRSTRAQAYAMVLYGLELAHRATDHYGEPDTDETKRLLFERWERFWALATLELRGGSLPRGDRDAMRGIRGANAAWRPGEEKLPLDFTLISRQQELGHLGAYLAPLRRAGLVVEGGLRPTPAALEILEGFWDEGARRQKSYDAYALGALDRTQKRIARKAHNLTLARVGERSRLTSLVRMQRADQQARLHDALFARAQDDTTLAVANLVETSTRADVFAPRDVLDGAIAGRFGVVDAPLMDLLITAQRFGDFMVQLTCAFDRAYAALERGGYVVEAREIARATFDTTTLPALKVASERLLDAPSVAAIRRFPMHGAACLGLADTLRACDADEALAQMLAYHGRVQRDRQRKGAWIREHDGALRLHVTSYTARPNVERYPTFKLDAVRSLLVDMGRLVFDASLGEDEGAR